MLTQPCSTNSSSSTYLLSGKASWNSYVIHNTTIWLSKNACAPGGPGVHAPHDRCIQRRVRLASFPQTASIEDLDLSATRGLERRFVLELSQCVWIANHLNTLVLGPTGSGKTFLASALGLSACRNDHTVRYFRTSRLLSQLAQSHNDGSYPACLPVWQNSTCSSWMTGCVTRSLQRKPGLIGSLR